MATEELPGGHCSRVYADETRVLKVPYQGEELTSGFRASLLLANSVGPRVYESDAETGSVLMERLQPGTKLEHAGLSDQEKLEITVGFIKQIQTLPTEGCMSMSDYFTTKDPLLEELLATTERQVFLHGDLHHENILRHGDRWVVIDPKGVVGDPCFEPDAFLHNPLSIIQDPDSEPILRRRIELFSELLDLNPWRVCAWAIVNIRDWGDKKGTPMLRVLERIAEDLR